MNLQMQLLRNVNEEFWLGVARECAYATFFHTPYWHQLARVAFPEARDRSIGVVLDSGVRVVIPLLETGRSLKRVFAHLLSGAFGCYGGPIADGDLSLDDLRTLDDIVQGQWSVATVELTGNPFNPREFSLAGDRRTDFTQVIGLDGKTMDCLIRKFSKGHRASSKKGTRMGVTVSRAETIDEFTDYFGAYEDSLNRWGDAATSRYAWDLFAAIWEMSRRIPKNIELWLAKVDDDVAAGALLYRWKRHCVYWHGAAYQRFHSFSAPTVLLTAILGQCLEDGVEVFDFNPSGGHEGVASFKKHFGAERRQFDRVLYTNKIYDRCQRLASTMRRTGSGDKGV